MQARPREYEALVLIGNGRTTLDHLVQALDVHAPQAHALAAALEHRGLVNIHSDWYASCLCYALTERGRDALRGSAPDGARGADTLRADEATILDTVARVGALPDATDLHWQASSTVQYLRESGELAVTGMVRPQLSLARSS
jgi:hypothetical protein